MAELTTEELQKINDDLVTLRKKIMDTGATALSPTPVWSSLQKEIASLNKKLNADAKAKALARETARQADSASA